MGSLRGGTAAGIPIHLHPTLLITFVLLMMQWGAWGVPAGVILFGSVLLHELGHALVARRFGLATAGIHLHLLGGVAMMSTVPRKPRHELWIAAAGPAVSLALGLGFGLCAWVAGAELPWSRPSAVDLLAYAAALNGAMAIFNLIPALPMDGGRVLRALLSPGWGPVRATRIAGRVSRVFAISFIGLGLLWHAFSLALIGLLLLWMSKREEDLAEHLARRAPARRLSTLPWPPPRLRGTREYVAHDAGDGRRFIILEP